MSIRPVDMQVVLPRSTEVSKTNSNLTTRADEQQQVFAQQLQKQVEAESRQVTEMSKTEKSKIDKDGENKNKSKYKSSKDKKEQEEKEKDKKKLSNSMYDISI